MIRRRAQPWLGTRVEITAEGDDAAALVAASDRAFARVAAVHAAMSFQSPDSGLTHVNRHAARDWVPVSPALAAVLAAALDLARASGGLFDPTVAAQLVASGHLPCHAGFPARPVTGWQAIELDGDRVRYAAPLLVDLSGIAKGYAVDVALASLRDAGVAAATVNAGGDLARFGDSATPVYVRLPRRPTHTLRLAELTHGAAATSADYFQPGHLRHPRSGAALCTTSSVTVLAADCTTADALTKPVAADPAGAPALLTRYKAQAIRLDAAGASVCDADGWRPLPLEQAA
ncbi:MAG: FAD:protein FMN transferase [Thiobacillus sp.]